jgi:hypothetical protein
MVQVEEDPGEFFGSVSSLNVQTEPDWTVTLPICGNEVKFKIDTGADISVMTSTSYASLSSPPPLQVWSSPVSSPGGPVQAEGFFTAETECKSLRHRFNCLVVKSQTYNLLSRAAASAMNLVARVDSAEVDTYGLLDTAPVKIVLNPDVSPYAVTVTRRVPIPLEKAVKEELE